MPTLIKPVVGGIYNFKFQNGYTYFNGVHKVVKIMTYAEYIADGGNIVTDFYEPNGKRQEDIDNTIDGVIANDILKVVEPNVESIEEVIYILANFFSGKVFNEGQCRVEPITLLWTAFHIEDRKTKESDRH